MASTSASARLQVAPSFVLNLNLDSKTRAPRLSIKAQTGTRVLVERSTNLTTWSEAAILTMPTRSEFKETPDATKPAQFYRPRLVP